MEKKEVEKHRPIAITMYANYHASLHIAPVYSRINHSRAVVHLDISGQRRRRPIKRPRAYV